MKTAFVTGATGFVGINLCKQLVDKNWTVHVLHRPDSRLDDLAGLPLVYSKGDICSEQSLRDGIPDQCDAVFHLAASTNLWSKKNTQQRLINVEGSRNVIAACKHKKVGRLIHTSSFAVWGFVTEPFNESTPWSNAGSWINYIKTKREAELLVKTACQTGELDAVILNPGNILGAYDRHNWSQIIQLIDRDKLPGIPPASGSFADVKEVAKAHISAYEKGVGGENYILGGVTADFLQLCSSVARQLGRKIPTSQTPASLVRLMGRVNQWKSYIRGTEPDMTPEGAAIVSHNLIGDSTKAIHHLGYSEIALDAMLAETIEWMYSEDMLIKT